MNRGIKITAITLLVLQIGLGFKSFMILGSVLENQVKQNIQPFDKFFLFASFLFGIFISIVFVILIFKGRTRQYIGRETIFGNDEASTKVKKKKRRQKDEVLMAGEEQKKRIIGKLNAGLAGINKLEILAEKALINISKEYDIMQGIFFVKDINDNVYRKMGAYAYYSEEELREFKEEVGLSGQVAANKKLLNIENIPDKYITVHSGLGKSSPASLLIFPVLNNDESVGVIELASFVKFDSFAEEIFMEFSAQLGEMIAKLNVGTAAEGAT